MERKLTEDGTRLQLTVEVVEEHGRGEEADARRQRLRYREEGQPGLEPDNLRPVAADELLFIVQRAENDLHDFTVSGQFQIARLRLNAVPGVCRREPAACDRRVTPSTRLSRRSPG